MNIRDRLNALEAMSPNPALVIIYRDSAGLSDEELARIDVAKAEGRPVKLIRTTIVNSKMENNYELPRRA